MNTNMYPGGFMKALLVLLLTFGTSASFAGDFSLDDLTQSDLDAVVEDFAANFVHTTVSPASSLGDIFGFEVGVVAGVTTIPGMEKVIQKTDPQSSIDMIPHAAIVGMFSVPMGFTGEAAILPTIDGDDDAEISKTSLAVKWTANAVIDLPVDLSIKAHMSTAEGKFTLTNPTGTTANLETDSMGLLLQVSKSFVFVEPYAGLGYVQADGEMSANNPIFDNIGAGTLLSVDTDVSSMHLQAGVNFNILFFKLGVEFDKVFESERVSAKASFYF